MKGFVFALMVITAAAACSNSQESLAGSRSIEGVFILSSKGEFSQVEDTLAVRSIKNHRGIFFIERKSGFQRVTQKGLQPKQQKHETAMGLWDEKTRQLNEQKHGRIYSLSADGNQLLIGSTLYRRIAGN